MSFKLNQKGVSLVEIIIIILLAGVMVVVISNLPQAISLIGAGNHESTAKQILAKKVTDVRSLGFDNLANGTSSISDSRLVNLPSSSGTVLIENCPLTICTNNETVKQVTISINWQESSKPKSVSIVTLVAKGGLR